MAERLAELRGMSDQDLWVRIDAVASSTSPGVGFYLEEYDRRIREREAKANRLLARRTYVLSWLTAGLSAVAIAVSVVTLIVAT
jgi:hypothetical protein